MNVGEALADLANRRRRANRRAALMFAVGFVAIQIVLRLVAT